MSTINQLLQVAETTSKLKVIDRSRQGYASKIKYIIKFMRKYYPDSVEIDSHGIDRLKLPLKFESVPYANIKKIKMDQGWESTRQYMQIL